MDENYVKLLTQAFMIEVLGYGKNLAVADILRFRRIAMGNEDNENIEVSDAENKLINRYKLDLIKIGVLRGGAKRFFFQASDHDINESYLSCADFIVDLKPYNDIPDHLKPLYRVAKVLNSSYDDGDFSCVENTERSRKVYDRFLNYYFSDGIESTSLQATKELHEAFLIVAEVFKIWLRFATEETLTRSERRLLQTTFMETEAAFRTLKHAYGYKPIFNEIDEL